MARVDEDKISVVLPVYNGEKTLRESIQSVLQQSYENLELIIVNDCSTDSSEAIAREIQKKDNRIRIITNTVNQKLPRSLNIGFKAATGSYLTWTSHDNFYHKDALLKMYMRIKSAPDIDFVYANLNVVDNQGHTLWIHRGEKPERLREVNVVGACFLYSRAIAQIVGAYDENRYLAEDYDYWIRVFLRGHMIHMDEVLYDYGWHDSSLTLKNKDKVSKIVFQMKSFYFYELYNSCKTQRERNAFLWSMLNLLDDRKVRANYRKRYYKHDKLFMIQDLLKRMSE